MPSRSETGLFICCAIVAILTLAILSNATFASTVSVIILFGLTAFAIHRLTVKNSTKRDRLNTLRTRKTNHLNLWIMALDALPTACVLLDKNKRVIHANKKAQDLATITTFGRPLTSYIRSADMMKALDHALAGYLPPIVDIHKLTPTERYLRITFTPEALTRPSTGQKYLLATISDVTEDKLSQMQKADFLANASHELKTPIASVMGYIETLQHHAKDDPEARSKFLGIMQTQAERMIRLIDDLLSLRKIEQAQHIAPEEKADINQSIISAINAVKPLADKRGVTIDYKGPESPAYTFANPDESVQLFLNLIDNAVKFTPRGDTVMVSLAAVKDWATSLAFRDSSLSSEHPSRRIVELPEHSTDDETWQVKILDTGVGLAREHLPRIGERFYRIAGDLSSKEKGTGLGLAIVKHIVMRHRAGLYLRSAKNIGTEFIIVMKDANK